MKKMYFLCFCLFLFFDLSHARQIEDIYGRKIDVPEQVERVIAIGPGALRIVTYLGAVEKVVGVERVEKGGFTPYARPYTLAIQERIKNLPLIGEGGPGKLPDFEAMLLLRPELIFACAFDKDTVNLIAEKTKTPVVALDYGMLGVLRSKKFLDSLKIVGDVLNKRKRAEEIESFMEKLEDFLNKRTKGLKKRPRVYVGGLGFKGQHGITSTEGGFLPLKLINAENVVDSMGKEGHLFIDKERLLSLDPDIIFVDINGLSLFQTEFKETPYFYTRLKAVREGNIYTILPYNYYNTNVEIALADAFFMGRVVYPDVMTDIDIEKKAEEIIRFFVSKPVYNEVKTKFGSFGKIIVGEKDIKVLEKW